MPQESILDCIVRFHDFRRLLELERCVFSLVGQNYRPLNIVLVLQRFTAEEISVTRAALAPLLRGTNAPTLSVHSYEQPEPADARTFMLNLGLSVVSGRYLAFLDYDDVLFPEAYSLLTTRLITSGAAIAFASVQLMRLQPYEKFMYIQGEVTPSPFRGTNLWDLFKNNFCPLHSYVMDRQRIPKESLFFDTTLTIEEDYDLLLRLCAQLKSDFSLIKTPVGYYFYKVDGSNTVAIDILDGTTQKAYQDACTHHENLRQSTYVSLPVQSLLGITNPSDQLTIRDILDQKELGPHCSQSHVASPPISGYLAKRSNDALFFW
jgi:hypothetical protein